VTKHRMTPQGRIPRKVKLAMVAGVTAVTVVVTGVVAIADRGSLFVDDASVAEAPVQNAATDVSSDQKSNKRTIAGPATWDSRSARKRTAKLLELARRAERAARLARLEKKRAAAVPPAVFRVSTLNVLGHSHTVQGGNKPGYASGPARMGGTVGMLRSQNVDVVALQELEQIQKGAFLRATGGTWGLHSGNAKARESVAWRESTWEFVEAGTRTVPYFHGNPIPMPWVLLRHRSSGREVYFMSVHNPTSNPQRGNNESERDVATGIQIDQAAEFRETGRAVVLMGDFNEREEAFCRVTSQGGMVAANGGSGGPPCSLPPLMGIDWIFGTKDLDFSSYQRIDGPVLNRLTDHPMIVATATYATPYDPEGSDEESENSD
jgi:endonuclease/exonuclease/phosphatase family metal-dependent hydrolase